MGQQKAKFDPASTFNTAAITTTINPTTTTINTITITITTTTTINTATTTKPYTLSSAAAGGQLKNPPETMGQQNGSISSGVHHPKFDPASTLDIAANTDTTTTATPSPPPLSPKSPISSNQQQAALPNPPSKTSTAATSDQTRLQTNEMPSPTGAAARITPNGPKTTTSSSTTTITTTTTQINSVADLGKIENILYLMGMADQGLFLPVHAYNSSSSSSSSSRSEGTAGPDQRASAAVVAANSRALCAAVFGSHHLPAYKLSNTILKIHHHHLDNTTSNDKITSAATSTTNRSSIHITDYVPIRLRSAPNVTALFDAVFLAADTPYSQAERVKGLKMGIEADSEKKGGFEIVVRKKGNTNGGVPGGNDSDSSSDFNRFLDAVSAWSGWDGITTTTSSGDGATCYVKVKILI